ncbi:MAG: RDD family protein [Candidatus Krumholzibacteriota bacterium]|nr:RDD family protein [Candidatus Krumholzibacteriota bacterium]
MDVEKIVREYGPQIIIWRWLASICDAVLIGALIGIIRVVFTGLSLQDTIYIAIVTAGIYYILLEGLKGYTLGKLVAGLRVVTSRGDIPGIGRASMRTLLRLAELNPVLLGGIPAATVVYFSKKRQRLGDMLAETFVIRNSDRNGYVEEDESSLNKT